MLSKYFIFKKRFVTYYLLVSTVILITIATQSIIQYSLNKKKSTAMLMYMAGRQRMLSEKIESEFYACRFYNCDFAEMKLALEKWKKSAVLILEGDSKIGLEELDSEAIAINMALAQPYMDWIYNELKEFERFDDVSIDLLNYYLDNYVVIMDDVVDQIGLKSEEDIKGLMIVELELAVFSVIIVFIEVFYIVNPIIRRIINQKKRLENVAWHQSHAFNSHMKNIKDLRYVMNVEKNPQRQIEIFEFIYEEIEAIEGVSKDMVDTLEENDELPKRKKKIKKKKVKKIVT